MNYLTNYYKNLSEQLQERVNKLEQMIKEAKTVMVDVDDIEGTPGERIIVGRLASGKGAQKTRTVYFDPEIGRDMQDYHDAAKPGAEPIEVDAKEIEMEPREKAGNVRGAGLKKAKKEEAIHGAELKKPYGEREPISFEARKARAEALKRNR